MKNSSKQKLRELYKLYELEEDQVFTSPQGWTIIKREGIDKIQAKAEIHIEYELVEYTSAVSAAVKAKGQNGKTTIETFGEAVRGKHPHGNTNSSYVLALAEKRAMSRAVLKLAGFYELGVFSEDESEDFSRSKGSPIKDLLQETL